MRAGAEHVPWVWRKQQRPDDALHSGGQALASRATRRQNDAWAP